MASVQPELGWIVYAGSDILHPIRFNSSKEGLDGLVRFQPSASGLEASQCARIFAPTSGRIPLAHCQFLIFRLGCSLPQMAWMDHTVQNQPGSDLVLADCVRFCPNGSGPEASRCSRIVRPASGQCFRADLDQMRIRSSMFTGEQFFNKKIQSYGKSINLIPHNN